ncbi:MAG: MFS transporter [Eubacteriaceae bacterium]|nr:MFS transporter [Eubacteriaceae bacterium]
MPIFAAELGATGAQIGVIASMSTIPGILISYIAGDLADRYGYKTILICSLLIFASAPFLYLLIKEPWQLGTVRFYHGFATAAFGPVAMATIAAFSGKNTGQNLSIYSSATMVGRAFAPTVGGAAYDLGGYRAVYLIAGTAGLLALGLVFWFFRKPGEEEDKSAAVINKSEIENVSFFRRLWGLLSYKPLLIVGTLQACTYFANGAFEMLLPLYAKQLEMPPSIIGMLLSVQLVGVILLKPFFGRASDSFGRIPTMITGFMVCACSFFLLSAIKSTLVLAPLIVVYGLGFALITASTNALAADVAKAGSIGASLGILSTLMDVGQTFGPPVIGGVSDAYSYSAGIAVLGAVLAIAALACYLWRKALLPDSANPNSN